MMDKFFVPRSFQMGPESPSEEQEQTIITPQAKLKFENIKIPKNSEFRITLDFSKDVRVKLLSGSAFLMGMELTPFFYYKFPSQLKSAYIYTVRGCSIELVYPEMNSKISHYCHDDEDGKNDQLFNLSEQLECNRLQSFKNLFYGPRVMLFGSSGSGKSTVLSILANLAVVRNWKPFYLNLDPSGSNTSLPGILSLNVLNDFMYQIPSNIQKLGFFFGATELDKRHDLYVALVANLMKSVESALDSNFEAFKEKLDKGVFIEDELPRKEIFASGIFIDSPTEVQNFSVENLKKYVDSVNPDYLIIIHNDNLKTKLQKMYKNQKTLLSLGINGGVSSSNMNEKFALSNSKIQNYFYSDWLVFLRDSVEFKKISVFKLDSMESLPLHYLQTKDAEKLKLSRIDPRITDLKGKIIFYFINYIAHIIFDFIRI